MSITRWKAILVIGVILVLSGAQVHVQAVLDGHAANVGLATATKAGVPLFGKVITSGGKQILIDGNSVSAGTTVFSGTFLRTLDSVSATILLEPAGKLDIAPNTALRIFFDFKKIEVELEQGCVILTTNQGTSGMIKTPAGTTERIGPEKESALDICTSDSPAVLPTVGQGAAANAGAGVVNPIYGVVVPAGINPLYFAIGSGAVVTAGSYSLLGDTRPAATSSSVP